MRWRRAAIVVPAALLLAFIVVRVAYIQAYAARDLARAAAIWPDHPAVVLESGLAEVGEMAVAGGAVDKALVDRLVSVSTRAPLAPEPFLVRGAGAQSAGNQSLALRAFLAARQRNPRAIAPRYFLANSYLNADQTELGLTEISALARLVPQSLPQVAPYLAAYARTPSAAPQVKAMLRSHPQLELVLLNELAGDVQSANLVISLWSGRGGDESRPWQGKLLNNLIAAGRFNEARVVWARFTGVSADRDRLVDPEFLAEAPPPFGWMLVSGPSGIAEPQGGGRLHVLYYGRDDLVLAGQVLTLPPGNYTLSMDVRTVAPRSESLSWAVRCLPDASPILSISLRRAGKLSAPFTVASSGCPAQRLELTGNAPEFPDRAEVTISHLQLQRNAGR